MASEPRTPTWIAHPFGRARRNLRRGARFRSVKLLKTSALADDLDQRDRTEMSGRHTQRVVARPTVQAARHGRFRHNQPSSLHALLPRHTGSDRDHCLAIAGRRAEDRRGRPVEAHRPRRGRGGVGVSSERRKRAYGLPASPIASSHPRQAGHPRRRVARQSLLLASAVRPIVRRMVALDRVQERRRAVALARHYRNEEGLSIADIARRLGRAEATVRAYL